MKKLLSTAALAAALAAVLAPSSKGAIVHYNAGQVSLPSIDVYLDFDTGSVSDSDFGGADVHFSFLNDNNEEPFVAIGNGWRSARLGGYAQRFNFGDDLGASFGALGDFLEENNSGNWQGNVGGSIGYLALRDVDGSNSREAWIALDYNDLANTLTVQAFAVALISDDMTAGQTAVPEPAATGVVLALLAGSVAIYERRRKRAKQAGNKGL